MEKLSDPRFATQVFPSNLADVCEIGDLDVSNSTYASFTSQTNMFHVLKRYVPEHTSEESCVSNSYEITPTFKRTSDIKVEVDPEKQVNYYRAQQFPESYSTSREEQLKRKMTGVDVATDVRAGRGMHCVEFDGDSVWVLFLRESQFEPMGSCVVFANGRKRKEFLQRFTEHVLRWSHGKPELTKLSIFSYVVNNNGWELVSKKKPRSIDTVFLPQATKDSVVNDLEMHLSDDAKEWYEEHGIPYKRMYLLYGSPGSGKTSLIQALAGHFYMNVCFMQPTSPYFTDDILQRALKEAPKNSIIVLEDIDAFFGEDRQAHGYRGGLSFSGLLNGLDGVATPQGLVFMMTTNHPEKLDAALIRDGRVDMKVEFPKSTPEAVKVMFRAYYPSFNRWQSKTNDGRPNLKPDGESDEKELELLAERFSDEWHSVFPHGLPMASVQQHFIRHRRSSAKECVEGVKDSPLVLKALKEKEQQVDPEHAE